MLIFFLNSLCLTVTELWKVPDNLKLGARSSHIALVMWENIIIETVSVVKPDLGLCCQVNNMNLNFSTEIGFIVKSILINIYEMCKNS